MKNLILTVVTAMLLSGCSTMSSWVGRDAQELVAAYGRPDVIKPDGKGGQMLTYHQVIEAVQPGSPGGNDSVYSSAAIQQRLEAQQVDTARTLQSVPPRTAEPVLGPAVRGPVPSSSSSRMKVFWADAKGKIYRVVWDAPPGLAGRSKEKLAGQPL